MTAGQGVGDRVRQELVDAVSTERLMQDTRTIAQWVRLSGSDDERKAFDYIEQQCRAAGATVHRYAPECYISLPGPATLEVTAPSRQSVKCITHSFAAPTSGLEGEVVYAGAGSPDDYARRDVRGKIVLTEGLATPNKAVAAEAAGVAGVININDEHLHEMIITPVWGAPTPETAHMIPKIPMVSVDAAGGDILRPLAEDGTLRVRITAQVDTGWRPIPCLTAEIAGDDPDGHFVMFSGHVDSWHYGAMDNGSANATMLETLRVLAQRPGGLRRGLRLAFWSGHSHGRYAASTWYCDAFWRELHDRCVVHVNVDSTGGVGATVLDETHAMRELTEVGAEAIRAIAGQELKPHRMSRSSDQSFWGVGLPAMFGGLSHQESKPSPTMAGLAALLGGGAGRSGGLGWWWHTTEDTIDKIDPANLTRDTQIFVLTLDRLCTAPVLPLDYAATAAEIRDAIRGYAAKAGNAIDLAPSVEAADRLVSEAERLSAAVKAAGANPDAATARRLNTLLLRLSRILVPLNYASADPFDHDLALPLPAVPLLRGANEIGSLDPSSDAHRFLRTRLMRNQNRVTYDLDRATQLIRESLGQA